MLFTVRRKFLYFLFLLAALNKEIMPKYTQQQKVDGSYSKKFLPITSIYPVTSVSECLKKFFELLYIHPEEGKREQTRQRVEDFYDNSLCITKWAESNPEAVQHFAEFFELFLKFPIDEDFGEQLISQIKSHLLDHDFKIEDLKSCKDSQKKNLKLNKVTRGQGRILLLCLSFHFNASFDFKLPKEIKELIELRNYELRKNSACIALLSENVKPLLNSICRILKNKFEDTRSTITKVAKTFAPKVGFGISVNISRNTSQLFDEVYKQEPEDPEIKTTKAEFDDVKVIIHEPLKKSSELLPGIVFIHGGGWVYRSPEHYVPQTHYLAKELGAVVVSVDYRHPPEFRYPIPLNDCITVTQYFIKNALNFNADSRRIGVIGDSAGGNMAASVSLAIRDHHLQQVKTQVLIYPSLQLLNANLPSYIQNSNMYGLNRASSITYKLIYSNLNTSFKNAILSGKHVCKDVKNSYASYFSLENIPKKYRGNFSSEITTDCDPVVEKAVKKKILNPYIFPLMAKDFNALPPTLLIINEFDILRDDGFLYAAQLKAAGVPVESRVIEGGFHDAMDPFNYVKIGKQFMDIIVQYLKINL